MTDSPQYVEGQPTYRARSDSKNAHPVSESANRLDEIRARVDEVKRVEFWGWVERPWVKEACADRAYLLEKLDRLLATTRESWNCPEYGCVDCEYEPNEYHCWLKTFLRDLEGRDE